MPAQRGLLDERGRGLALVVSLAATFGADGNGLHWFWMPWDPAAPAPLAPVQTLADLLESFEVTR